MDYFNEMFEKIANPEVAVYLSTMFMIVLIALLCIAANFVTKKIVLRIITHIVNKNKFQWDNILLEQKVFHRLSHIVPAIIIYYFASTFSGYQEFIEKASFLYIFI